jgi:hypothetical protein
MQQISETAGFARLVQISRDHFLRADSSQEAREREANTGLFKCEIAAEKEAVQAPEGTEDASNEEKDGGDGGLTHGGASGGLDQAWGLAENTPVHVGPKRLTANTGQVLDVRAQLDRSALAAPLIGGLP